LARPSPWRKGADGSVTVIPSNSIFDVSKPIGQLKGDTRGSQTGLPVWSGYHNYCFPATNSEATLVSAKIFTPSFTEFQAKLS
jgi:hypothetical protein